MILNMYEWKKRIIHVPLQKILQTLFLTSLVHNLLPAPKCPKMTCAVSKQKFSVGFILKCDAIN